MNELIVAPAHPDLPRLDLVVYRDDEMRIITGVPAAQPIAPPPPEGWTRHAIIRVPPTGRLPEPAPARGGPWTSHGHPIPGVTVDGPGRPTMVARCGGPALCTTCARDAARIREIAEQGVHYADCPIGCCS